MGGKLTSKSLKAYRDQKRNWVEAQKRKPCADCGRDFHPFCMDFDHRPNEVKEFAVSAGIMLGKNLERIAEEIAKCDVVCAVCHRMRTLLRRQDRPVDIDYPESMPTWEPKRPTHCPQGHEYTEDNTRVRSSRGRYVSRECIACVRERDIKRGRRKRRGAKLAKSQIAMTPAAAALLGVELPAPPLSALEQLGI